jgi:peptidoglycan/LPS O-acetylase OafA/YrhL
VHVPIIVGVNHLVGGTNLVLGAALSIAAAVLIAMAFWRFVEQPAHRLARVVGRETSARYARLREG